jgi:hypothetical protein
VAHLSSADPVVWPFACTVRTPPAAVVLRVGELPPNPGPAAPPRPHHGGGGGDDEDDGDDEDGGDDDNECYRHSMTRRNHLPTTRPPAAAISSSGGASCLVRCSASGPRAPAIFVSHICSSICLSILSSQRCPTTSVLGGTI